MVNARSTDSMFATLVPLLFSIVVPFVNAQNAVWIYPPHAGEAGRGQIGAYDDDGLWQVGSTQTLEWQSSLPTASLTMIQELPDGNTGPPMVIDTGIVDTRYEWVVNTTFYNLTKSPIFFLGLSVADSQQNSFITSHYFNITLDKVVSSVSTAPTTATSSSMSMSTGSSVPSQAVSGSNQLIAENSGLSQGTRIGIGILVPLLALAAALGFVLWYLQRRRQFKGVSSEIDGTEKAMRYPLAELSVGPEANQKREIRQWQRSELGVETEGRLGAQRGGGLGGKSEERIVVAELDGSGDDNSGVATQHGRPKGTKN